MNRVTPQLDPNEPRQLPSDFRDYEPVQPRGTDWRGIARRLWAPIVAVGAFLAKFGAVLLKFKFLFSMFVSLGVYVFYGTYRWGWPNGLWFGLGLIGLLFIHEMGHVLEAKRQGLPVSAPMFIPFLGAFITMKRLPQDAWHEALNGIAGPILGSAGALVFWAVGELADIRPLIWLAFIGFFINLFNLVPVTPLDGGRIAAAIHPAIWFLGFIVLLGLVIVAPNPLLIIVLILIASDLWQRWQMRRHPEFQQYYKVAPSRRLTIALLYFCLAAGLALAMHATHVPRSF